MASDSRQAGSQTGAKPVDGSRASFLRNGISSLKKADWTTFSALLVIVLLGAYLRFYFDFQQSIAGGFPSLSGGSDADFYFNVVSYALGTGHQMLFDPMLNYPIGSFNPFLPFYVWSVVLLSWPVSFLLHIPVTGSIYAGQLTAGVVAYSSISALSGVGAIIVTYYIGKELFSKEAGIVAAAFMAFLPSIVSESTAGFGVHDPFVLMLTAIVFYFFLRSLNTINGTRWIDRWKQSESIRPDFASIGSGIARYYHSNKRSLLYAAMSGVVLAGIANAWEGYSYILVIMSLFYLIQSFIYKFKNRDTLALTAIYALVGTILVVFAAPVYYNSNAIYPWYYVSVVFFIGTLLIGVVYTVARDIPWLTLLSALVAAVLIVVGVAELVDRSLIHSILGRILNAQSYFIKSAVYTTIAEAQSPPFSLLALSLGGAVFFVAFAEVAYTLYRKHKTLSNAETLMLIWFFISAFMAVSTVRFVLDATTTFVLFAGEGIYALIRWTDFGEIRKGFQTYGMSWSGTRKSIKIKHVLVVIFIAFVVVMPVVWTGIDAATPSNTKNSLNNQVYDVLPSFLRPPGYAVNSTSTPYYFGAFGYSLETPNTYFPDAWSFINNRTSGITPYSSRPAYLSWWDYGSAVITFANVPTVADDFQQGYQLASAFLFSQNQTQAISLLVARVLNAAFAHNGNVLPGNLSFVLSTYGINSSYVQDVMANPDNYKNLVLTHPAVYGPFATSVSGQNVMYAVLMVVISKIGLNNVVNLYQDVSQLTNDFIGFFSVDARLFPFSATNTGVFYAPALLGGRPIAGPGVYNIPYNYYTITASTSTGVSYPLQSIPSGSQVLSYNINYQPMFYNMTMYRFFMGYSAYDLTGQNLSGLPGLSGNFLYNSQLTNLQPMPGWMESHFEMVYRTAYYNPYPLQYVKAHPNDWSAISYQKAVQLINKDPTFSNYTVDISPQSDFENGIVVMQYYPGAYLNGTVLMSNGQPAAGVRVTVLDQWGIPHDVVYTNSQGQYSAIAMAGNDTVVYSTGPLSSVQQNLTQVGTIVRQFSVNVTNSQAMRYSTLNASSGLPTYAINTGTYRLGQTSVTGHVFFTTPSNSTYTPGVTPLVRNVSVELLNTTTGLNYTTSASAGVYTFNSVLPGVYNVYVTSGRSVIFAVANLSVAYAVQTTQDIAITPYYITGTVFTPGGATVGNVTLSLTGADNSYSASQLAAQNGTYAFDPLLPGNYTIYISSGGYSSSHYTISAVSLNFTKTYGGFNLTALSSASLSGYVDLGASVAPNTNLYFYSQIGGIAPFSTTTDSSGHYSLDLAYGNYTVYALYLSGANTYAVLQNISLQPGSSTTRNFQMSQAYPVAGHVMNPDGNYAAYASMRIQSGGSFLNFTTNSSGSFSFMLPAGTYGLWTTTSNGAYLGTFAVAGAISFRVDESAATTYIGQVITNYTGQTVGLSGAAIQFTYGGFTYHSFANLSSLFAFSIPSSVSTRATFSYFGMVNQYVSVTGLSTGFRTVAMTPVKVTFSGSVTGGVTLPAGATVDLKAANGTVVSLPVVSGSYSAQLIPGGYSVSIGSYNSTLVQYTLSGSQTNINVPVGLPFAYNANVTPKYNVTIYFDYPSGTNISNTTSITRLDLFSAALTSPAVINNFVDGGSLYLAPANYTVYAFSQVGKYTFAYLAAVSLGGRLIYHMNVLPVVNLTGTVYYSNQALGSSTVYITSSNGASVEAAVQSNGSFSVSLPSTSYTINASYTTSINQSGQIRYVAYYGQTTVNLTSTMNVNIMTKLQNDNTTVTGTSMWFYGLPVQSVLKFVSGGGSAVTSQVNTTGSGSFSISLAPGNYTVETYSSDGTASNITQFIALPGQSEMSFNPVLTYAYRVQGNVTIPGIGPVGANVTFSGAQGTFSITSAGGRYSLLLPEGSYAVDATYNRTVDGTVYSYGFNASLQVISPSQLGMSLLLVPTYSVTLRVISTPVAQESNGFAQVSLLINNTGDVSDAFYVSVNTPNWYGSFNPTYVILGTGANSTAVVNATLSSSNPSGGNNTVIFSATSLISTSAIANASAEIQVPRSYGFSTAFSSYGSENSGGTITFSIVVNNTGNTASNFRAAVTNIAGLGAEGWSGGIYTTSYGPFQNSTTFLLQPHQNQTLTVSLTPAGASTSTLLPVVINVTETATGSSYALGVPISLPKPVVQLTGISVSGQGSSIMPPPIISLKRAVIIFVLASLIVASVYFAKKRRLIR